MISECREIDCCPPDPTSANALTEVWMIADLGTNDANSQAVADFLDDQNADAIIMAGDLDYLNPHDYDLSVDQYYAFWKASGLLIPVPGNHDWDLDDLDAYMDYFDELSGKRYYSRRIGPFELFCIDSGINTAGTVVEPDGNTVGSVQHGFFTNAVNGSSAPWKVAVLHHSPYSSDSTHGDTEDLQWDFAEMGIDVVLSGHGHTYEHILLDDVHYFVNGLGGGAIYNFGTPVEGSVLRFNGKHGALRMRIAQSDMEIAMFTKSGVLVEMTKLQK